MYNSDMNLQVIVEEHTDGFVAYPVGLKGVVVAEGNTYDEAVQNVQSAIDFHLETFGVEAFSDSEPVVHVFLAEARLAV